MKRALVLIAVVFLSSIGRPASAGLSCADWMTEAFFGTASAQDVRDCLDGGENIAGRDNQGRTPLHLAVAAATDSAVVGELLRGGADLTLADTKGRRPIHVAAAAGIEPNILSLLVAWGSDVATELPDGRRCPRSFARCATAPLHLAAARPDGAAFVANLLAAGAEPGLRDSAGRSSLLLAAENSMDVMPVTLLLRNGASVDTADFEGSTPLHAAAKRREGAPAIIETLLAAGASADKGDDKNTTPVLWGARKAPDSRIVALLIDAAKNPCRVDDQERTAIALWDRNNDLERDDVYWALHDRCSR